VRLDKEDDGSTWRKQGFAGSEKRSEWNDAHGEKILTIVFLDADPNFISSFPHR